MQPRNSYLENLWPSYLISKIVKLKSKKPCPKESCKWRKWIYHVSVIIQSLSERIAWFQKHDWGYEQSFLWGGFVGREWGAAGQYLPRFVRCCRGRKGRWPSTYSGLVPIRRGSRCRRSRSSAAWPCARRREAYKGALPQNSLVKGFDHYEKISAMFTYEMHIGSGFAWSTNGGV